ncbi:hypothetical protein HHI36_011079 [Cryptolaemus montrouzieri]|uniref:Uncharacterized protein n=1 Tax=Cryptolaemus montrouzieri TaxID=559131 RepID=A0ABD2ML12_9CUCU
MAQGGLDLKHQFKNFSKFGDEESDGTSMTISQVDRWLLQANIIDMDHVTTTNTGVCFNKFRIRKLNFKLFQEFLQDLANDVGGDFDDFKERLENCGLPGTAKKQEAAKK